MVTGGTGSEVSTAGPLLNATTRTSAGVGRQALGIF